VLAAAVSTVLAVAPAAPYDVVFSDPPYPMSDADVTRDLTALVEQDWLVPGALVVVERAAKRSAVTWPDGLEEERTRKYGETALWYGHAT
jgi:16S rRNA (guanine966-N2)-methyltransferase